MAISGIGRRSTGGPQEYATTSRFCLVPHISERRHTEGAASIGTAGRGGWQMPQVMSLALTAGTAVPFNGH